MSRRDSPVKSQHGVRRKLPNGMLEVLTQRLADLQARRTPADTARVELAFRNVEPQQVPWIWGLLVERVPLAVGISGDALMFVNDTDDEAIWIDFGRLVRFDRSEQMARKERGLTGPIRPGVAVWGICVYSGSDDLDAVVASGRKLRDDELTSIRVALPFNPFTADLAKRLEAALAADGVPRSAHGVKPFLR
jgi:hypothetical protein